MLPMLVLFMFLQRYIISGLTSGAVKGYEGLWLCDASVFRHVPLVNPYLSVITLAERLVARWLA